MSERKDYAYREPCKHCNGNGFMNWMGDEMCQQCNGTGYIRIPFATPAVSEPESGEQSK